MFSVHTWSVRCDNVQGAKPYVNFQLDRSAVRQALNGDATRTNVARVGLTWDDVSIDEMAPEGSNVHMTRQCFVLLSATSIKTAMIPLDGATARETGSREFLALASAPSALDL